MSAQMQMEMFARPAQPIEPPRRRRKHWDDTYAATKSLRSRGYKVLRVGCQHRVSGFHFQGQVDDAGLRFLAEHLA